MDDNIKICFKNCLSWLSVRENGGLSWIPQRVFWFHKMWGISWLAKELLASQGQSSIRRFVIFKLGSKPDSCNGAVGLLQRDLLDVWWSGKTLALWTEVVGRNEAHILCSMCCLCGGGHTRSVTSAATFPIMWLVYFRIFGPITSLDKRLLMHIIYIYI